MQLLRFFRVQAFGLCAICLVGFLSQAHAGEFPVSGSHLFIRDNGQPVEETVAFDAPVGGNYYLLRIYNGAEGTDPVTSAAVEVNGSELLFPNDFNPKVEFLEVPASLQLQNTLTVRLGGKPGSGLSAEVIGIDNDNPSISADIDPQANIAGWHNVDATVTFTCEDGLSGIEICTDPQLVSEEGADQQIAGTAVDKAGNIAETQVAVSLDKTAPQLTSEIAPSANAAGWHRETVTVSYQCADNLSGVANCQSVQQLDTEGADQPVSASATDIAGNSVDSEIALNVDLTPPQISAQLSAPANENGWHSEAVTVSYICSDDLSGIADCPEPQTLNGDGENQQGSGTATDLAGNSADTQITVNLDQTAPEIGFVSPANGALLRESQPQLQLLLSDNLALDGESLQVTVNGSAITGCEISGQFAHCSLSAPLASNADINLSASVHDLAGNPGQVAITTAIDSDGDSVADYADLCPGTTSTQSANSDGCALEQLDTDDDGVNDAEEIAAGTDPEDPNSFPPVTIETFVASPSSIDSVGQQVELRWRVRGAGQIQLNDDAGGDTETGGENLASEGSLRVEPQITTNYTLKATGPGGEISQELTVKLQVPTPPPLWTSPSIPVQEQIATSLAVAEDGSAYVGAFDGNFYKVNPSGQVEWTLEDAGLVMGKAAIAGGRVIVGANISGSGRLENDGRVYALDADKNLLWHFDTEGAVVAGPLLNTNRTTAYIATYTGHLYALNTESGEQLWHYQLLEGQTIVAAPALSAQKLIVHTEEKMIFALDASVQPAGERILWSRNLE